MARDDRDRPQAEVHHPQVSLVGKVCDEMVCRLTDQLAEAAKGDGSITVEMTTMGGDPEAARRMILEIDLARERMAPRPLLFLGKTSVYSAGATFMAGFPRDDRYLTRDATLLIHCRQMTQTIELDGPIRSSKPKLESLIHQIDLGIELEIENFKRLIEGSDVTMDELLEKALYNWYVPAREAADRGLVAGLV